MFCAEKENAWLARLRESQNCMDAFHFPRFFCYSSHTQSQQKSLLFWKREREKGFNDRATVTVRRKLKCRPREKEGEGDRVEGRKGNWK